MPEIFKPKPAKVENPVHSSDSKKVKGDLTRQVKEIKDAIKTLEESQIVTNADMRLKLD